MLTVAEVAKELGYSRKHVYNLIDRGYIKAHRDPFKRTRTVTVPQSEIDRLRAIRGH